MILWVLKVERALEIEVEGSSYEVVELQGFEVRGDDDVDMNSKNTLTQ